MDNTITTGVAAQMLRLRGVKATHKEVTAACNELDIKVATEQHGKRKVYLLEYSYDLTERLYDYFKKRSQQPKINDRYALLNEYRKARIEQAAFIARYGIDAVNTKEKAAYAAYERIVEGIEFLSAEYAKWDAARKIVEKMAWTEGYYQDNPRSNIQRYANTFVAAYEAALAAII